MTSSISTRMFSEHDVRDQGAVPVLDVHGDVGGVNDVAVFEDHVGDLRGARLGADLEGPAPVVPDHTTAGPHIPDRTIVEGASPGLQTLEHQAVVERPNEAVADRDVLAVAQVDAVGVVPPETDELDVRDHGVGASEQGATPYVRVAHHHALDPDVSAVGQANGTTPLASFEVATVDNSSPEHPDVGQPRAPGCCREQPRRRRCRPSPHSGA